MQDILMMLTLALLTLGHVLLIKKCASLESEIPEQTNGLKSMISDVRDLLDEALDVLADVPASSAPLAQMTQGESLPNLILSTLISRMSMPATDGTQEPQNRAYDEINTPPTLETENELD
ncbi:hypothetical protein N9V20_00170 [Candidatus Poseidoniales archaeon]|nr:hypothetical protein [Candidatus Poseidoniales archaeon]